ncbi:protein-tyrosine-phosphatase [Chondrinema litorale]|uniref:protein-tyrosine-phosphatase n=1 Tax=Chondrinema litorale TaxID=2994555 RepID=UPI0025437149|nr:protein-tyrosine-phosphatase [Chondrinema litorale]UZR98936.1 protein-tyrosine-phosphatase [Chondrinema litorale]
MKIKMLFSIIFVLLLNMSNTIQAQNFNNKLKKYTNQVVKEFHLIDESRRTDLKEIGDFLLNDIQEDGKTNVIIICTHNSRRSHISQLWLQTAAIYYGINGIQVFSGGLEATAFHPNAVDALDRVGFTTSSVRSGGNPVYTLSNGISSYILYSKKYTDHQNPQKDFTAIMVCSDADKSCPIVQGADERFSLPFEDPRYYDDTPSQNTKYDETVRLIAREMFYLADYIKDKINIKLETKK